MKKRAVMEANRQKEEVEPYIPITGRSEMDADRTELQPAYSEPPPESVSCELSNHHR